MFGSACFLVGGNMAVGVTGSNLMVRPGPENFEDALTRPHARPMDFTGHPMKGFVF
ncbi:MAG TPA: RNA methyltransferase, partial [Dehalococcoidia bacterium]|nr:RNA methyltransferase [Dehalococcoidia bacterium]